MTKVIDEIALLKGCLQGNSICQRQLYELYSGKMFALCLRYMANYTDAEDMLQEGFVTVFTRMKDFRGEGSLEGWVRRIMTNQCLMYLRKKKSIMFTVNGKEIDAEFDFGIEEDIHARDLLKIVQGLPAGYRVVFNMYAIEGFSHKEIASSLGISEGTSKSQYSRARKILQEQLTIQNKIENEKIWG